MGKRQKIREAPRKLWAFPSQFAFHFTIRRLTLYPRNMLFWQLANNLLQKHCMMVGLFHHYEMQYMQHVANLIYSLNKTKGAAASSWLLCLNISNLIFRVTTFYLQCRFEESSFFLRCTHKPRKLQLHDGVKRTDPLANMRT